MPGKGLHRLQWLCLLGAVWLLATASAAPAAEGGGAGLNPGNLGQAIAAILIFVVLLAILGKYAWKPITHQLELREQRLEKTLDDAARREQESQRLLAEYKARLERAESDAQRVVEESRKEAARAREDVLAEARKEAEKQAAVAAAAIERARLETLEELHEQTAQLAADVARQVIGTTLDGDAHRRLVEQSLSQIRTQARPETGR